MRKSFALYILKDSSLKVDFDTDVRLIEIGKFDKLLKKKVKSRVIHFFLCFNCFNRVRTAFCFPSIVTYL